MTSTSLLEQVSQHLATIAVDEKYKAKVLAVVDKKLGPMLYGEGEDHQIAQDALATVITNTLGGVTEGRSTLTVEDREIALLDVQKYVMCGVTNYCDTRLRRWSLEPAEKGSTKETKNAMPAVRARMPIMSDEIDGDDFWDQHKQTSFNDEERDSESINRILEARGLTAEQLTLVKEKLSGVTFTEMARTRGGSEDKYRKIYNRAIQKAGIGSL